MFQPLCCSPIFLSLFLSIVVLSLTLFRQNNTFRVLLITPFYSPPTPLFPFHLIYSSLVRCLRVRSDSGLATTRQYGCKSSIVPRTCRLPSSRIFRGVFLPEQKVLFIVTGISIASSFFFRTLAFAKFYIARKTKVKRRSIDLRNTQIT